MKRERVVGTNEVKDILRQIHHGHPFSLRPFPRRSTLAERRVPDYAAALGEQDRRIKQRRTAVRKPRTP